MRFAASASGLRISVGHRCSLGAAAARTHRTPRPKSQAGLRPCKRPRSDRSRANPAGDGPNVRNGLRDSECAHWLILLR